MKATSMAMPEITKPAIVVVGHSRPRPLRRLLASLAAANYKSDLVDLVISLDHCDKPAGAEVRSIAESFQWHHGPKRLIIHEENLGLREHILRCGDLSKEYGSIIVFEDDISAGRDFYGYAQEALAFSDSNENIAGISLYDHRVNYLCRLPFTPIYDGFDNYYLQIVSSWGQAWDVNQWLGFRNWYDNLEAEAIEQIPDSAPIPRAISNWPSSSWAKYFIWYLAESNRFFLYPRFPHSTNNSDAGTHMDKSSTLWQVPLSVHSVGSRFSSVEESIAVYDSFFEILPQKLKEFADELNAFEFDIDLWGNKQDEVLKNDLVLTSRIGSRPIKRFHLIQKPMEANFSKAQLCGEHETGFFSLINKSDLSEQSRLDLSQWSVVQYFYGHVPIRTLLKNLLKYIWQRLS